MSTAIIPVESPFETTVLGEPAGVQFTKTGMAFNRTISIDEWTRLGEKLKTVEGAVQWWIGDWLNYGEKAYGEKYTEAVEATGYEYDSIAQMKRVAGSVEFCLRRQNLSWSHHKEVAGLEPEQQIELLDWAENTTASVRDLRAKIKGTTDQPELNPLEELQQHLSRLCPSRYDGQAQNTFVQLLEKVSAMTIPIERAELAHTVSQMLGQLAKDCIAGAKNIRQNMPQDNVA